VFSAFFLGFRLGLGFIVDVRVFLPILGFSADFLGFWPVLGFSADFLGFQSILGFLTGFNVQIGFRVDSSVFGQF
jgi:hypothetical protein